MQPGGSSYWNAGAFAGYNDEHTTYGGGYSYNSFGGQTKQGVGAIQLQIEHFGLRFDEDFIGDGYDHYRTGALLMTYRVNDDVTLALGGSMMTGQATSRENGGVLDINGPYGEYDNCSEDLYNLRGGAMYGGVIYKG